MDDITEYVQRFQSVVDDLTVQGADTIFVMFALLEVVVMTARRDPSCAAIHLEGAAAALSVAAKGLRQGGNTIVSG